MTLSNEEINLQHLSDKFLKEHPVVSMSNWINELQAIEACADLLEREDVLYEISLSKEEITDHIWMECSFKYEVLNKTLAEICDEEGEEFNLVTSKNNLLDYDEYILELLLEELDIYLPVKEVHEYYAVDSILAHLLENQGEYVVEVFGTPLWHRTLSGQSVTMDRSFQQAALLVYKYQNNLN